MLLQVTLVHSACDTASCCTPSTRWCIPSPLSSPPSSSRRTRWYCSTPATPWWRVLSQSTRQVGPRSDDSLSICCKSCKVSLVTTPCDRKRQIWRGASSKITQLPTGSAEIQTQPCLTPALSTRTFCGTRIFCVCVHYSCHQ